MTEAEWVATGGRTTLHDLLPFEVRRQRLFACACCRLHPALASVPEAIAAVEAGERFADTRRTKTALRQGRRAVRALWPRLTSHSDSIGVDFTTLGMLLRAAEAATSENTAAETIWSVHVALEGPELATEQAMRQLYRVYRDIAADPTRPVAFRPEWRTATAVQLARQMYESREFGAMPILADALQDSGCETADVLDHCRDPHGVHVRGCWVVDLVLGKA